MLEDDTFSVNRLKGQNVSCNILRSYLMTVLFIQNKYKINLQAWGLRGQGTIINDIVPYFFQM